MALRERDHWHGALRKAGAGALACAALLGSAAAADAGKPGPVRDPHYGDALFEFYQDRYFSSITALMVSQHFERVSNHADDAEVLRGGLLLSYGLHREAGEIFTRLIDKGAAPEVRDRAWFYLAKIRYQRGFIREAQEAVGRIGQTLPRELEEDRLLLQSNLLMSQDDFAGAARLLADTKASARAGAAAGPFVRFNLGVALVRSGDVEGGTKLLDEIGKAGAADEDQRTLRDRANVALGFAALQQDRAEDAQGYLERVRLEGSQSNKALLAFGWAAAALKKHKQALVPWTELSGRDGGDAAVLEARIAVPYAFAELGAYGQALERYTDAIANFEAESGKLDQSIAAIRSGKLVDGLLERNPGEEMGWFWQIDKLPELPYPSHLAPVLSGHDFQEAFKNFRDLRFLSKNLQDWRDKLGVFGDALQNRRQAFADRVPKMLARAEQLGLPALKKRREDVGADLDRAAADADGVALADDKQRDLLARVARSQATLEAAGDDAELVSQRERLRLAAGALAWDLAQQHPGRLWEAQKSVKTIDDELAESARREAALAQAQLDEPARFDAFGQRIAALEPRIAALIPRVVALSSEQQSFVQELAVAELQRQKERLAAYATQARFAVAQLYDRANAAREADRANKP
jgi:hypothetical protein